MPPPDRGGPGSARQWLPKVGLGLGVLYAVVAAFAVLQFNYRVIQTQGIFYWIMPGALEATVRGAFWPYSWWSEHRAQERMAVALSDSEWSALQANLPTPREPTFTPANLSAVKTVLSNYTARTGHPPQDSNLEATLRLNRMAFEWRAEAEVSVAASWKNGVITNTPRYVELTERLDKSVKFADPTLRYVDIQGRSQGYAGFLYDQQYLNEVIEAASKHQAELVTPRWTTPLWLHRTMEQPFRNAAAGYDAAIAALATK